MNNQDSLTRSLTDMIDKGNREDFEQMIERAPYDNKEILTKVLLKVTSNFKQHQSDHLEIAELLIK